MRMIRLGHASAHRLLAGMAVLGWIVAGLAAPLPAMIGSARAQVVGSDTCTATASAADATATVSGGSSIAAGRLTVNVTLGCTFDTDAFATCSSYAAANADGALQWTAIRQDGTTQAGSGDNRIAVPPAIGQGMSTDATTANTRYGNHVGTADSFPIYFNYAAASGAMIESGIYEAMVQVSPVLIDVTGGVAPDENCSDYGATPTLFPLPQVAVPITLTVPPACDVQFPAVLDFGDVTDTSHEKAMNAAIAVNCNSNSAKYNVYIDGGTGTDNGALTMSNGADGALGYGLFSDPGHGTAFPRNPMGASAATAGPYEQKTAAAGGSVTTIYGLVPAQPRPATGSYSDRVMIHVEY